MTSFPSNWGRSLEPCVCSWDFTETGKALIAKSRFKRNVHVTPEATESLE